MKKFIYYSFSLLLLYSVYACQFKKNPPNVILILTDDQGWGDLSLNGNQDINTPNLDQLGRSGARFDRFLSVLFVHLRERKFLREGTM